MTRTRIASTALVALILSLMPLVGDSVLGSEARYHDPEPLCTLSPTLSSSALALTGDVVTASLRVKAQCRGIAYRTVVILGLVEPVSWDSHSRNSIAEIAHRMASGLPENPSTYIGAVAVVHRAPSACTPTNDSAVAERCLDRALTARQARGHGPAGHPVVVGLEEAHRLLRLHRKGPDHPPSRPKEVVVLFTPEEVAEPCASGVRAAHALKRDGALIVFGAVQQNNSGSPSRCGSRIAQSNRYVFFGPDFAGMLAVFDRVREDIISVFLRQLEVLWLLEPSMEITHSDPDPAIIDGRLVKWRTSHVTSDGFSLELTLKGSRPGATAVAESIELVGVDNMSGRVTATVDPPTVLLFGEVDIPGRRLATISHLTRGAGRFP